MIFTSANRDISTLLGTAPEEMDSNRQKSDRVLLTAVIILMASSIPAVYSAIAYFAESKATTPLSLIFDHMVKLGIAFFIMLIVSKINYHTLARFSRFLLVVSWLLLISVMIFGTAQFGAKRWLSLGFFSFQPSSLASVALIMHISTLLAAKQDYIKDFRKSFLPIMIWVLVTCGLIGAQDFSSAGVLLAVCIIVMFIGRVSATQIITLVALAALTGGLFLSTSEVRLSRITEYLNQVKEIEKNEILQGRGYQAQQAQIAIAKGGLTGVGIGKSTQRNFLPAPYNDFIFAIIAEEYGILGALGLIAVFTLILFRGISVIARKAKDFLGTLLAAGFTLSIVMFGFVNAGVASGLLPVTGLPMPFISYGGTSMLFTGIMVGVLLNISKHSKDSGRNVFYA